MRNVTAITTPTAAVVGTDKEQRPWEVRRVRKQTPLRLKRLLLELGLSQADMAKAMTLANGVEPSKATISQIVIRNLWPTKTPKKVLKEQISAWLREVGATEEDIETAFKVDSDPDQPASVIRQNRKVKPARVASPFENQLPETEMLSQAARKHFQLFRDPFVDDVQSADDVFLSADQRYIREAMFHTAKNGGFIAVVGESGAGKTTLRRDLIDRIQRDQDQITIIQPRIIDKGRLTAGAICDAIIGDVSSQHPRRSLEAKARQIEELLTGSSRAGNSHVLMIEEAHDLTVQTLKYLKRFYELEDGFKKLLSIILVGQPELKNKLDERQNWDAREVIRRCEVAELQPLNGNLEEYMTMKFKRVGKELADVFDADAFDAIRERLVFRRRGADSGTSMMYPLVVNNAITKALNLAAEIGAPKVNSEIIKEI